MSDNSILHHYFDLALEKATRHGIPGQIYRVKQTGGIWLRFEHQPQAHINGLDLEPIATIYPQKKGD